MAYMSICFSRFFLLMEDLKFVDMLNVTNSTFLREDKLGEKELTLWLINLIWIPRIHIDFQHTCKACLVDRVSWSWLRIRRTRWRRSWRRSPSRGWSWRPGVTSPSPWPHTGAAVSPRSHPHRSWWSAHAGRRAGWDGTGKDQEDLVTISNICFTRGPSGGCNKKLFQVVQRCPNCVTMTGHKSPIYDECKTQSAWLLALPWERAHQDNSNDTSQPICECQVVFPLLWIKAYPGLS